ncbi:phage tail length tape measure family protein [Shinella kummerowiae]|uniref:phage tail length tape measure family protein n=1 Tax=Shinella kummerowiae TaxID=417745 RepID=UPI0021B59865|nr:phage tail length tape measure family protein [Shinella kummerowiae]MCT7665662.1 phage tail length tape measure family protein [Shinella kummerowiae]
MTVAIRSLRVTADIDGRQYAAGGKQVDAANESMAASSLKAAQAMAQADRQAGQSGGVLASLSRQYLTGYKGADEFEKAVARLSRGIEKGAVPLDRVETILGGIYQKYGLTANAAALLENGQTALGNAATVLNGRLEQQQQALEGAALAHQRMANAANDNAFKQRMLMFQLNDVFQSIALGMPLTQVALQQGPQIAQIYGPGEGGIGRAFRETGQMIGGVLTKFPLVTAGVLGIGAAFAAMTYEINQTTDVAVGFGDVALASFQVLGSYIWDELQPAVNAIAPWFQTAWDGVIAGVKWLGNGIIATIKSAIDVVVFNIGNIPNAFKIAGEAAANGFIAGIEFLVQKALEGIKKIRDNIQGMIEFVGADQAAEIFGFSGKLPEVPTGFELGRMDIGGSSAQADMDRRRKDLWDNIGRNYDQDYLGDYFKDVRDQAIKNAQSDDKKKGGGRGERESDYERTIRRIREQTEATKEDTRVVDLSTYARERQSAVQDILTAAQRDGMEVGKAFANAQELINASTDKLSPALVAERQRVLDVASAYAQAQADAEKAEEAQRKFKEAMEFAKETTRGFFDDFKNSLENGATVWEAFADAALNALDRVVDKLLNDVLDAIFEVNSSGGAGGESWLGSIFGGLFGGGAKADPWAGARVANAFGNVYRSQSLSAYSNQIVDKPTYFAFAKGAGVMGEAGDPEAIMPLRRDASGRLGVSVSGDRYASANDNRGETIIRVALGDGLVAEILRKAEGQAVQVVQTNNEAQRNLRQNGGDF